MVARRDESPHATFAGSSASSVVLEDAASDDSSISASEDGFQGEGHAEAQVGARGLEEVERADATPAPRDTECRPKDAAKATEWRRWRQHTAALIANVSVVAVGVAMGWTSPALPVLLGEQPDPQPLRLSLEGASWASAALPLGALMAAPVAGMAARRAGRRAALLALGPPCAAAWIIIAFADEEAWLVFLGRLILGFVAGPCTVFVPLYCEEIAESSIRGALGSYLDMMMVFGNIVIYSMGAMLPYFWYTVSSASIPLVFTVAFWWMPESPLLLVSKGRTEDAQKALRWLRGPSYDIQPELTALNASIEKPAYSNQPKKTFLEILKMNPFRHTTSRAFMIVLGLMFFQQMSGINVFIFYAVQIFNDAGSNLSGHACSIIIGFVHFFASLVAVLSVDKVGRRSLLLLSSAAATVSLTALAVYSFFYTRGLAAEAWSWVPLTSLIVYLALYSVGFGTLPWFMMAELMPEESKAWAASLAVCFNRVLTLLLTKEFPLLMQDAGQDVMYAIFAAFCGAACIFVGCCVPETKGKSKAEIRQAIGGE